MACHPTSSGIVTGIADGLAESGTLGAMDKPKVLSPKELRVIMPRLSGWKLARNKLTRTFEFQDFVASLSFLNSLVAYFEIVDHHPDVHIAYGEVTFELTRYDLGGRVTDRDVEVAKKISSLYRARS
jgi:4a-hydroxytetrahydrobiopterin dehydratase